MKDFQLTDRVVVEIYGDGEMPLSDLANKLHLIADQIEDCIIGNSETEDGVECLWEHECQAYGGFRMGDKSLIAMHYYGSEPKPITISAETFERVKKWKEDCDNTDTYTDGDMVDKAMPIFDAILWEGGKS